LHSKKKLKKLGRGYLTPDPSRQGIAASPDIRGFTPMKKTQSLDYRQPPSSAKVSISAQREQEKKLKLAEAALYRQKILASATTARDDRGRDNENADIEMNSPGYHREKATDKQKMKQQQEIKKSKKGTATFWQTVFNMANILMGVGMLGLPYLFMRAGWIGGFTVCTIFAGCYGELQLSWEEN